MTKTNNYSKGILLCLTATILWGCMFPVMTSALKTIDPFTFTSIRYLIAGAIFLFFLYYKEGKLAFKIDGNKFLLWLFGSAGFAGFGFLVFLGQKLAGPTGALSASIMMATIPLLGLFVIWGIKGVRPPLFSFGFMILSFLGVLLVITKGSPSVILSAPSNYLADLLMILGALCWVFYTIGGTYYPHWSPLKYTAMSTLFGLPTILGVTAVLILTHTIVLPNTDAIVDVIPELLYMSLIAGFIGVLYWNMGNKIITPLNGVLFMNVIPVIAFLVSTLLGVTPVSAQVAGIILTTSALVLNNVFQRRKLIVEGRLK